MFFFKKEKTLNHRQCSMIGFVLALLSVLSNSVLVYGFPALTAWLRFKGVFALEPLIMALTVTLFLSVNGLLLFGFPLYYVQDQKNHMTGFQILLYAFFWMLVVVGLLAALSLTLTQGVSVQDLS